MKYRMLPITSSPSLRFVNTGYEWRSMKLLFLCLLLASLPAQADSAIEEQIRQLESSLLQIHQNQQNIFQQFQMVQELRRYELRQEEGITSSPPSPQIETYPQIGTATMSEFLPAINIGGSPPSYEETVKQREVRQKRLQQYTSDLDQLHIQYLKLEEEKKTVMEKIGNLIRSQREESIK